MARNKIVAGNWKMYTLPADAATLAKAVAGIAGNAVSPEVVLCPPFTSLDATLAAVKGSAVKVGGQNMHWEDEGAYTGEVAGKMLLTMGCSHVILGHSERRQYFFETDFTVNSKLKKALELGLTPIVCVGETLDQREADLTNDVIRTQIAGCFDGIPEQQAGRIVVAYEPVWAIGTGKTATPAQAEEVHVLIRGLLGGKYGKTADGIRILYGGSVKPDNARELFGQANIDGGLVGGASLKAESFNKIIDSAR